MGYLLICIFFFFLNSDLYGIRVRPVAAFGSVSSKDLVDPALIHRCLPDELLFEVIIYLLMYSFLAFGFVCVCVLTMNPGNNKHTY